MNKSLKKYLLVIFTFAMALCLSIACATVVSASDSITPKQVSEVTMSMYNGVQVRLKGEENNENGLRFGAKISAEDYEFVKANTNYKSVTFGIVIAPAEWTEIYELTEENLFGQDAKYCWDGTQEGKAEIINLEANNLSKNDDGDYFLMGSIVGLKDYNIARHFTARAYVKAVDFEENASYKLANWYGDDKTNNVYSMTEVALKWIADEEFDNDSKNILKKMYMSKSVAINYYLETAESSGEFVIADTSYVSGSNGQTVTVPTNIEQPVGYFVNSNQTGTVLSSTIDTQAESNTPMAVYLEKVANKVTVSADYDKDSYCDLYYGFIYLTDFD